MKNIEEFVQRIFKYNQVILYGAGGIGKIFHSYIMDMGKDIDHFMQTKKEDIISIEGIPLLQIDELSTDLKKNAAIVITVENNISEILYNTALHNGCENVFCIDNDFMVFLKEYWKEKLCIRNQMMSQVILKDVFDKKKILLIAPHPDDEVIGCGGLLALYGSQIDVLCINSSGVFYPWEKNSAKRIAEGRIDEFYSVMKMIGVNRSWIAKIWGNPPMFDGIGRNFNNYLTWPNYEEYDFICVPDVLDGHREHRYLSNKLLPELLNITKVKENLKIAFYDVWSAMSAPNYYLDISDIVDKKKTYIDAYKSRKKGEYAKRILGLNQYRGLISGYEYAEAYRILSYKEYLNINFSDDWKNEV